MAKVSRRLAELRAPNATYTPTALQDLKRLSSSVDWQILLKDMGVAGIDSVIVGQPEFFKALNGILKATPVPV